jgi:lipoyl(octanoyl) transferase
VEQTLRGDVCLQKRSKPGQKGNERLMGSSSASFASAGDRSLQVYLLGSMPFEAALDLQRRLVFQVSSQRNSGMLLLCEHPPLITVGRQGSRSHILCDADELRARQWQVRWVNRGGGCLLHLPGQLAIYPILALDYQGLGVPQYLEHLQEVVLALLKDFHICAQRRREQPDVCVGSRLIASVGVAVRDWVTYYGMVLNVNLDLALCRRVRAANDSREMTSLERERRGPLRPALVRERFIEHFADRFRFSRVALFFDHPVLSRKAPSDAVASRS